MLPFWIAAEAPAIAGVGASGCGNAFEGFCWRDDGDALVVLEVEQIGIAGDDQFGVTAKRDGEHEIIIGVGEHYIADIGRHDECGDLAVVLNEQPWGELMECHLLGEAFARCNTLEFGELHRAGEKRDALRDGGVDELACAPLQRMPERTTLESRTIRTLDVALGAPLGADRPDFVDDLLFDLGG
jgi:hypothetical protein